MHIVALRPALQSLIYTVTNCCSCVTARNVMNGNRLEALWNLVPPESKLPPKNFYQHVRVDYFVFVRMCPRNFEVFILVQPRDIKKVNDLEKFTDIPPLPKGFRNHILVYISNLQDCAHVTDAEFLLELEEFLLCAATFAGFGVVEARWLVLAPPISSLSKVVHPLLLPIVMSPVPPRIVFFPLVCFLSAF